MRVNRRSASVIIMVVLVIGIVSVYFYRSRQIVYPFTSPPVAIGDSITSAFVGGNKYSITVLNLGFDQGAPNPEWVDFQIILEPSGAISSTFFHKHIGEAIDYFDGQLLIAPKTFYFDQGIINKVAFSSNAPFFGDEPSATTDYLSNGTVSPPTGTTNDTFLFTVDFYSASGGPLQHSINIDGMSHVMRGSTWAVTWSYEDRFVAGAHNFRFEFVTASGKSLYYPIDGSYLTFNVSQADSDKDFSFNARTHKDSYTLGETIKVIVSLSNKSPFNTYEGRAYASFGMDQFQSPSIEVPPGKKYDFEMISIPLTNLNYTQIQVWVDGLPDRQTLSINIEEKVEDDDMLFSGLFSNKDYVVVADSISKDSKIFPVLGVDKSKFSISQQLESYQVDPVRVWLESWIILDEDDYEAYNTTTENNSTRNFYDVLHKKGILLEKLDWTNQAALCGWIKNIAPRYCSLEGKTITYFEIPSEWVDKNVHYYFILHVDWHNLFPSMIYIDQYKEFHVVGGEISPPVTEGDLEICMEVPSLSKSIYEDSTNEMATINIFIGQICDNEPKSCCEMYGSSLDCHCFTVVDSWLNSYIEIYDGDVKVSTIVITFPKRFQETVFGWGWSHSSEVPFTISSSYIIHIEVQKDGKTGIAEYSIKGTGPHLGETYEWHHETTCEEILENDPVIPDQLEIPYDNYFRYPICKVSEGIIRVGQGFVGLYRTLTFLMSGGCDEFWDTYGSAKTFGIIILILMIAAIFLDALQEPFTLILMLVMFLMFIAVDLFGSNDNLPVVIFGILIAKQLLNKSGSLRALAGVFLCYIAIAQLYCRGFDIYGPLIKLVNSFGRLLGGNFEIVPPPPPVPGNVSNLYSHSVQIGGENWFQGDLLGFLCIIGFIFFILVLWTSSRPERLGRGVNKQMNPLNRAISRNSRKILRRLKP